MWYKCKRTAAGRKVFSRQFVYCRADGVLTLFSDGGLAWFKSSKEGAKARQTGKARALE